MAVPPSYADSTDLKAKNVSFSQRPQGHFAILPVSPSPPAIAEPTPASAYPSTLQPGFPPAQPVSGNNNIVMMGANPFENVETPNGVKMVRRILGKTSSALTCQFCNERVTTQVEEGSLKEILTKQEWIAAKFNVYGIVCISPCFLFLPLYLLYRLKPLSAFKHMCPRCNACIGVYHSGEDHFFYTSGTPEAQYAAAAEMMRQRRS